ncbi:amiloride-sensitive sodium channel subunit alpha-like [Mytilus californianus]|uniref:amiloride-sensitive sodium channel subunit alpha-like n=1 Tax=Mytilus californianus TaxID=6549 RepID=UPI002246A8FD|nr:amiloride-sensitive sodium channel subunit alpha-like [Mytilus californianus]
MSSKKSKVKKINVSKMRIRTNSSNKPPSPVVDKVNPIPAIAFASKSKNKFRAMLEEQIEKDRSLTVKERFDIFISETSFTALTKICKAGNIFKQIIWLILVLAMLSWLCIQCYWLFEKYLSYPYEVKIELKSIQKMEFPSVTVCNRNPIRQSKFKSSPFDAKPYKGLFEVWQNSPLYDKAVNMMQNQTKEKYDSDGGSSEEDTYFMSKMKNNSINVWSALSDPVTAAAFYKTEDQEMVATFGYATIASEIDQSELKSYGHQIEDFLVSCRFRGMPCSPENFTFVPNVKYGNCFTFNAYNNSQDPLYSTYSGPLMGLSLELNVQQYEYIPALAPDAAVRVLVHTRGTFPALEDDGFSIPVGFMTSVGLKVSEITRLTPPHASCAKEGKIENLYQTRYGVIYEKATCTKTCQQNIWKEKCGCVVPLYEKPENSSVCDCMNYEEQACLWEQMDQMQECELMCPNSCFEKKFEPLISVGTWPSKHYEDYLDYKIKHSSLDFMGDDGIDSDENLAKVEVYFREMMYETIEQQKAYESQNLISDVGGQLGLWLGLSAVTIGEMFEFIMAIFKAVTARAVRRRNRETAVEALEDYSRRLSLQDFK